MTWRDIIDPTGIGRDILGFSEDSRISRANEALDDAQSKAEEASTANKYLYGQYNQRVSDTYGDLANKFKDYMNTFENQEVYDPGKFTDDSYGKSIDDFYSKFANQRLNQAMSNLRESSDIFSSDYQDAMAAKQQALASEEWDKAYDRYIRDRERAANEFNMNASLGQQAYNNTYNKNKDLMGIAQGAQDNVMNAYGNYINNLANQNNINAQNYANMVQAQAANQNTRKSLLGRILGE